MTFNQTLTNVYRFLKDHPERSSDFLTISRELAIDSSNNSQFYDYFQSSNHFKVTRLPKRNFHLSINQTGIDYYNSLDTRVAEAKRDERIKDLQLRELEFKIESIESKVKEQRAFWVSSADRNKEQVKYLKTMVLYVYIITILSIASFILSILSYFK